MKRTDDVLILTMALTITAILTLATSAFYPTAFNLTHFFLIDFLIDFIGYFAISWFLLRAIVFFIKM